MSPILSAQVAKALAANLGVNITELPRRPSQRERLLANIATAQAAVNAAREAFAASGEVLIDDPWDETPDGPAWTALYDAQKGLERARLAWAEFARLQQELSRGEL